VKDEIVFENTFCLYFLNKVCKFKLFNVAKYASQRFFCTILQIISLNIERGRSVMGLFREHSYDVLAVLFSFLGEQKRFIASV